MKNFTLFSNVTENYSKAVSFKQVSQVSFRAQMDVDLKKSTP